MKGKYCRACKNKKVIVDFVKTVIKNKGRVFTDNKLNVIKKCPYCCA